MLAIWREFPAVERPDWCSSAEDLWLSVNINDSGTRSNQCVHFCAIYLCKQKLGYSFSTQLVNFTDRLSDVINLHPNDKFVIVGDFNLSNVTWIRDSAGVLEPCGVKDESQTNFFD